MSDVLIIAIVELSDHMCARQGHLTKEEQLTYNELLRLLGAIARANRLALEDHLEFRNA